MMQRLRRRGDGGGGTAEVTISKVAEEVTKEVTSRVEGLRRKKEVVKGDTENKAGRKREGNGDGGKRDEGNLAKKPKSKFQDRLNWKRKNLNMPTTSTPIRDPKSQTVTKIDIDTAFGFDESVEEKMEYSTVLSPIAHASPKDKQPAWKIHPLSQKNVDLKEGLKKKTRVDGGHLQNGAVEERRSPRIPKGRKVITIPISSGRPTVPCTSSSAQIKKPLIPMPPPSLAVEDKDKTPVYGDVGLPSELESNPSSAATTPSNSDTANDKLPIQVPVTTSVTTAKVKLAEEKPSAVEKRSRGRPVSKKPVVPAESVEIVEENVVELEEVPKKTAPSRRAKRNVSAAPTAVEKVAEVVEENVVDLEEVSKKTAPSRRAKRNIPAPPSSVEEVTVIQTKRATRPKKPAAAAVKPEEIPSTSSAASTAKKVPPKTKPTRTKASRMVQRTPAPVLEVEPEPNSSSPEVFEFEADDELEITVKPVKTKTTTTKSRAPRKTKTATASSNVTTSKSKVPLHLVRKPQLFDGGNITPVNEDQQQKPTGTGSSPFSQLLHRYNEEEEKDDKDVELHVDPKKIVRTYASRKRVSYSEERDCEADYDFIPKPTQEEEEHYLAAVIPSTTSSKPKRKKNPTSKTKKKDQEEDLDEQTRKWLEEKNKEFEDVAKVKLVIEQSFSD